MIIGIDLDNTLVSYDAVFHAEALARGLIGNATKASKSAVKEAVVERFGNSAWTLLQSEVYGPKMSGATLFEGALDFIRSGLSLGFEIHIISHKTRFAAMGSKFDLRQAAINWLEANSLVGTAPFQLPHSHVHFCDTRAAKVEAIGQYKCDVFIDDLPEVFSEPHFPSQTQAILFGPESETPTPSGAARISSWRELDCKRLENFATP